MGVDRFGYILDRILKSEFSYSPFRHLYIENLFLPEDFESIVSSPEVTIPRVNSDEELLALLEAKNFKAINFPGTTTDIPTYLKWHKTGGRQVGVNNKTCEGFGVTLRLQSTRQGSIIRDCEDFFKSSAFWDLLAEKFDVDSSEVNSDFGLQKYLDGYEISPHPDIRRKALTFMVNINPSPNSENLSYHTHYMKFKPAWESIQAKWETDTHIDRTWVNWDQCDTVKMQTRNNSIVIFRPANDTLHAVKASYDHLGTQRTQLYGNLWYKKNPVAVASSTASGMY